MKSEPTISVEDACELVVDCPHSTPRWTDSGVVVLRNENIRKGRLTLSKPSFTDEEHYLGRVRRAKPRAGDIVFTREAPIGEVCMIPDGLRCCLGQRQVLLRPSERYCGKFMLYALQGPFAQRQIMWNEGTGSTVSNVRIPALKALRLPYPEIEIQERRAGVLASLDDCIDHNRTLIVNLERVAGSLYESWFVEFNPVRANAAGVFSQVMDSDLARLFPDQFVDSAIGEVPKGWDAVPLSLLVALDTTSAKPFEQPDHEFAHFSIPALDSAGIPVLELGSNIASNKYVVKPGSILVSKLNPSRWRCWLPDPDYLGPRSVCSTEFMQFIPVECNQDWLWGLCQSRPFKDAVLSTVGGTTGSRQRAKPNDVIAQCIIKPPSQVLEAYSEVAGPLLEKALFALREVGILSELRDLLLPRLISGKLDVGEVEAMVTEAI